MSSEDAAAMADEMQAQSMRTVLGAERDARVRQVTKLVKSMTTAMTSGVRVDAHQLKRSIRGVENEIMAIDRMLAALNTRFPERSVSDSA